MEGRKVAIAAGGGLVLLLIVAVAAFFLLGGDPEWYVRVPEGDTYGPMGAEEFEGMFAARRSEVVVNRVGTSEWLATSAVPELAGPEEEGGGPAADRYEFDLPEYHHEEKKEGLFDRTSRDEMNRRRRQAVKEGSR